MARERKRPMSPEQAIKRAVTGRAGPAPGATADQVRALEAQYGREGARQRLGRSERSMRRYRAGGTPSRETAERIQREAAISPRREARLRNRGAYVRLSGNIGGGSPGPKRKNTRHRTIGGEGFESIYLPGEAYDEIFGRYYAGDDEGMREALRDAIKDTPWGSEFGNFDFGELTGLEFLRDDPNG